MTQCRDGIRRLREADHTEAIGVRPAMDRILAPALKTLAIACGCGAALLALGGFIDFLVSGRWPDQSLLRLAYDTRLISARWFLIQDWRMPIRDVLAAVPATLALLAVAPLFWMIGGRLASR